MEVVMIKDHQVRSFFKHYKLTANMELSAMRNGMSRKTVSYRNILNLSKTRCCFDIISSCDYVCACILFLRKSKFLITICGEFLLSFYWISIFTTLLAFHCF